MRRRRYPQMAQMGADENGIKSEKGKGVERDPETYAVIGAAMEVHSRLGPGFLEGVYHEALGIELKRQQVPFRTEVPLEVWYRGERLGCSYRADLICFQALVVELKALARIGRTEKSQLLNYLRATGFERGLLLNFGGPKLDYERCVWTSG